MSEALEGGALRIARDEGYCAFPVGGDTYRACAHGCLYCFDPQMDNQNLRSARQVKPRDYRELFNSLYTDKDVNRFVMQLGTAVRLGICSDPFPAIERQQRVTLRALELLKQVGVGVIIPTKAPERISDEYLPLIDVLKVSFSTFSDAQAARLEPGAPRPSARLAAMRTLRERGLRVVARLNPFLHTETYDLDALVGAADGLTVEPLRFSVTWRQTWPIEFWAYALGEEPPATGCFKRGTPEYKWAVAAEKRFFAPLQSEGEPYNDEKYHWVLTDPFKWRAIYSRLRAEAKARGLAFGICTFGCGIHNVDLNDAPYGCAVNPALGYDRLALVPQWHEDQWAKFRLPALEELGSDLGLLRLIYANSWDLRPIALDGRARSNFETEE